MIGTAAVLLLAAACSAPSPGNRPADAQQDAELLAGHVLQLLDQAAAWQVSHRGRPPSSVAQLGLDSLTPEIVRRIRIRNDSIVARVGYRRTDARAYTWCEAPNEALEEASLNSGAFTVVCEPAGGGYDTLTVGGPA